MLFLRARQRGSRSSVPQGSLSGRWPVKQQVISRSMTAPPPFFILWPIVAEGGAAVNRAAQIGAAKFFACTLLHFSRSLL